MISFRLRHTFAMTALGAIALGALLVASCSATGGDEPTADEPTAVSVVATTSIWADVVAEIGAGQVAVEALIPIGADAHTYQPSSRELARIAEADLIVTNGLGLEEGLEDAIDAARTDGAMVLELAPHLDPEPFSGAGGDCDRTVAHAHDSESADHDDTDDDEGDGVACDPHVWMDPDRLVAAAALIAAHLSQIDPTTDWSASADAYAAVVESGSAEIEEILSVVPADRRTLVTNHDAIGYFARRFGLEVVGVVISGGSTLNEPSSADVATLVATMQAEGVDVVFAETSAPTTLAETLAAEVGPNVQVVELYTESLGEPGSGADTVVGMLVANARLIAGALGHGN